MKSITGEPQCPACKMASQRDDAFFPEHKDGLDVDPVHSMYHRPAFHWECYLSWQKRKEFANQLFNRMISDCERSTLVGRTYVDDDFAIFATVYEPHFLTILLRETGRKLNLSLANWVEGNVETDILGSGFHKVEKQAIAYLRKRIWHHFPDAQSYISKTDWTGTERPLYAPN